MANFLLFFSFMLMTPLFPVYLSSEFGADKDTIGWVMAGYSITAVLARFVSGYLVDSFPRMVVLVVSYLLFTLCTGAYLLAGSLLAFAVVRTLHGAPFGATTVANSTVAVDSLPFSRRAEGIGYYGLSNNVASALAPSVGLAIYGAWADFDALMWLAVALAVVEKSMITQETSLSSSLRGSRSTGLQSRKSWRVESGLKSRSPTDMLPADCRFTDSCPEEHECHDADELEHGLI